MVRGDDREGREIRASSAGTPSLDGRKGEAQVSESDSKSSREEDPDYSSYGGKKSRPGGRMRVKGRNGPGSPEDGVDGLSFPEGSADGADGIPSTRIFDQAGLGLGPYSVPQEDVSPGAERTVLF